MGDFSAEDRALLERYAPCLAYDPQDGLRATAAATMTDNDANALRRKDGVELAAGASLSLATLTDYPATQAYADGDYLASTPLEQALIDAMALQARFPHVAYGRVLRQDGRTWLQYWLWYYDNPKTFAGKFRHQGDWELVQVGLDDGGTVTCSQHNNGQVRAWADVPREPAGSDHPLIFVAPFSHANYFEPRTIFYFPAADHPTGLGPRAIPRIEPFGAWQAWKGRWGADLGPWGLGRTLGGRSPDAPIAQTTRWNDPARFCAAARTPVKTAGRDLLWRIGGHCFPHAPTLHGARYDDGAVEVRYALHQSLWRRSRSLLLTVIGREGLRPLAGRRLVRGAPREGTLVIGLRHASPSYEVWACTFNRFGQRSDLAAPHPVE